MTKTSLFYSALLSSTMISGVFGNWAFAADVEGKTSLPAVSAINGKFELGGGFGDLDNLDSSGVFYGAGSLSIPLGDTFGFQADFAAIDAFDHTLVGGAAHLFTRDPSSYLLGAIGGYSKVGALDALWGGAEAELYMDNITFAASAGYMNLDLKGFSSKDKAFALADVNFYPTENLMVILGVSSIAGLETAGAGFEWYFADQGLPISLNANARFGENSYATATAGITFYFGGNEGNKSLIRRHREDDPVNAVKKLRHGLDVYASGVGGTPPVVDPETACLAGGGFWDTEAMMCYSVSG